MKRALLDVKHLGALARFAAGRSVVKSSVAVVALVAALGSSQTAKADSYTFSVNGSGITASGVIWTAPTGPLGASTVTGISGWFTDGNDGISGAITGVVSAPPPTGVTPGGTFGAPAFTDAGFSHDNLFWINGDSPAVCVEALAFFGGDFDIYGLAFTIDGGYTADLWSDGALGGYQLNDSFGGVPYVTPSMDGLAYGVSFDAAPTPEPESLVLLGTGLSSLAAFGFRRRFKA